MVAAFGGFDAGQTGAILDRVTVFPHDRAEAALKSADIAFEAVPETKDAKHAALAMIGKLADPDAVIASTPSTFLSTQHAGLCGCPERFLNAHWLNHAFPVPLVELSPAPATGRAVVECVKPLLTWRVEIVVRGTPVFPVHGRCDDTAVSVPHRSSVGR